MLKYICSSIFLLSITLSNIRAQDLRFKHLGVNDGLSQSTVHCIYQDSKGFIWLGTGDGLNRYDGYQFEVFKHNNTDSFSISNNTVRNIIEDNNGNLWVGTDGGVNKLDRLTNRFTTILVEKNIGAAPLFIDEKTVLWFWVHGKGLASYDIANQHLTPFYSKTKNGSLSFATTSVTHATKPDSKRKCYLASNNGLMILSLSTAIPKITQDPVFIKEKQACNQILEDGNVLWITSTEGIIKYDIKKKRIDHYPNVKNVGPVIKDKHEQIWVGSCSNGLFKYDETSNTFKHIYADPSIKKESYSSNLVKSLLCDKSGNLWIGTDGTGIDLYSPNKYKFKHYNTETYFAKGKPQSNFIKCFTEDGKGNLWVGTLKGIDILDTLNNSISPLQINTSIPHILYTDNDGSVWIGTDKGLFIYDLHKKTFAVLNNLDPTVLCIIRTSSQELIIGTQEGVFKAYKKSNFKYFFERISELRNLKTFSLFEDSEKQIWAGTVGGIFKTNNHNYFMKAKPTTINNTINVYGKCFAEDKQGAIWVATNKGLLKINPNNSDKLYTLKDGLPDLMTYGVIADSSGNLWISSNKGLSCFNTQSEQFRNYDVSDGLQSYEYNSSAFYKSKNEQFYFGGINGFNTFNPTAIKDNPITPSIALTKLKLFDIDLDTSADFSEIKKITLRPSENILSFEFTALEFTDMVKNKYAYKMEGIDEDWVYAGSRNFARYANIIPGNYIFKVKATNNDGIWSNEKILLNITLLPPWWQRWWAVALMLTFLIASFVITIRYLSTRELKKQVNLLEKKQAINQERTRISKDMHDDLGSGLSSIAIMSGLLKQQLGSEKSAEKHLEKIAQTASDLVDNMSHIIWAMNPENDHINDLIAYTRQYALDFFENSPLSCEIDFPDNLPNLQLSQEARRNIFLVVKESLNNVLKHATASNVTLQLRVVNHYLELHITDNGIGFDINTIRPFSNGLRNMRKRMKQISGTYTIKSSIACGTVTIITVPLGFV
jgi:ligand-binding sensor domain-containing protein/signal transduction histidine kinase